MRERGLRRCRHFGFSGFGKNEFCVQRLDEAGIDEANAQAVFGKFGCGGFGHLEHGAETDKTDVGAALDEFAFADFEELRFGFGFGSGAGTAGISDRGRAVVVVGHGPKHIDKLVFVFGLHVNETGNGSEVTDIKEAVVGGSVITGKSTAIHTKTDGEVLEGDVVHDHVEGPLHES